MVAHFFRRAFGLLTPGGCFGLIATNTIAQGDTRVSGLAWIRQQSGSLYTANRRVPWPGQAAVMKASVYLPLTSARAPSNMSNSRLAGARSV